jgi:hypothetical protein
MDAPIRKGRLLIIGVVAICLCVSITSILFSILATGPRQVPQQLIRFGLTVLLCVLLYQGRAWVRWVLGILLALAAILGLLSGVALRSQSLAALILVGMGLLYTACVIVLFFSSSVRAFLAYQHDQRI